MHRVAGRGRAVDMGCTGCTAIVQRRQTGRVLVMAMQACVVRPTPNWACTRAQRVHCRLRWLIPLRVAGMMTMGQQGCTCHHHRPCVFPRARRAGSVEAQAIAGVLRLGPYARRMHCQR